MKEQPTLFDLEPPRAAPPPGSHPELLPIRRPAKTIDEPIGVYIRMQPRNKFVGKLRTCRDCPAYRGIESRIVFYKEVPWKHFYSFATDSVGCDTAAWFKAWEFGADYLVAYCKDRRCLAVVSADAMNERSFKLDLGEFLQTRVARRYCVEIENAGPLNLGYTRDDSDLIVEPFRKRNGGYTLKNTNEVKNKNEN